MQDRFEACDSRRLVALLDFDSGVPESTGSSFIADSDARDIFDGDPVPQIDGYEITGRLGEGGMGVVWRALQRGTRRTVALKVRPQFAPGASKARLRFEREIELAARLEHPHIARVYDSGVCRGLDYYGMELIDGAHLDHFVAHQKLRPRQILRLMREVSLAVHYAHQRGVIHRDIKPSNILVTPDGQPHVVDFGLAKALAEQSNDPALTQEGQYTGTPAFMSPEQASGKQEQIDTRTDVWGLGATLYLLLIGHTPHDTSGARYEVIRRVANEEVRRPRQLNKHLDVELESLLLKALAHDPEQRYGTAAELAQDIDRYLTGEPLKAAPPSKLYRLRKYATKHRWPIAIAAAFVLLLLGATVFSVQQARQIAHERDQALLEKNRADEEAATAEAVNTFLTEMLGTADPGKLMGEKVTVVEAIHAATKEMDAGKLSARPLVEAAVRDMVARTLLGLGRFTEAEPHARRALELRQQHLPPNHLRLAETRQNLATVLHELGRYDEAEPLLREALANQRTRPDDRFRIAMAAGNLAVALNSLGKLAEAETLLTEVVAILREGEPTEQRATALHNLGKLLEDRGKVAEVEPLLREALDVARVVYPNGHPLNAKMLTTLGTWLTEQGRTAEAEPLLRESLELRRRVLPAEHPFIADSLSVLAELLGQMQKFEEAESLLRKCLALRKRTLPAAHPSISRALMDLGVLLVLLDRHEEARELLREALDMQRRSPATDDVVQARNVMEFGVLYAELGDMAAAEEYVREALDLYRAVSPTHPYTAAAATNMGRLLRDKQNRNSDAEPYFREALEINRKVLPQDHTDLVESMLDLSRVAHVLRNYEEAESLAREALDSYRRTVSPDHWQRLTCHVMLAAVMHRQERFEEALAAVEEALSASPREKLHPDLVMELDLARGLALAQLLRWDEAYEPLTQAYARMKNQAHGRIPELAKAMVDVCDATGRNEETKRWRALVAESQHAFQSYDQAEVSYRQSLERMQKESPDDHAAAGRIMSRLADILHRKKDLSAAEEVYRQALVTNRRALPPEHLEIIIDLNNLFRVLTEAGKFEDALLVAEELKPQAEKADVPPMIAEVSFSRYAVALANVKRWDDAEPALREARERLTAIDHLRSKPGALVLNALAELCDATNRPDEAAGWRARLAAIQPATQPTTAPASH